ncbi:ABC transporter permease subunit [Thermomonospora umbrina]|uniref:ABC-2 type transport system permease protein n=1 Tax=Thermomonospora umbrina TaxID=111806 RepID=A0A3D9SUU7_9ACTN|nr:ABC transporter permease subunit [Thermomonospora umbrina]REE96334.1 ABC-2 type transport system permease protein [Thermomonospora umbrina]
MNTLGRGLHAEWTKVFTQPGAGGLLLAVVIVTPALSMVAVSAAGCPPEGCDVDPAKLSLTGVALGQAIVAVLAALMIGGEYGTGMIRTTLTAMPRRTSVLAAKAAVLTALVTASAAVAVAASLVAGRLLLPSGVPPLSLGDGAVLRAAVGSVLYLALIALLAFGVTTAVRDSATAAGIVLGLLYLFPLITQAVSDEDWQRRLRQIGPMDAGLAVQATTDLQHLPIGPWKGLGVLALWAGAALLAGGLLFHRRDA